MTNASSTWVSDYTYKALFRAISDRQAATNGEQRKFLGSIIGAETVALQARRELATAQQLVLLTGVVTPEQAEGTIDAVWTLATASMSAPMLQQLQMEAAPVAVAAQKIGAAAQSSFVCTVAGVTTISHSYHVRLIAPDGTRLDDRAMTPDATTSHNLGTNLFHTFAMAFPAPSGSVARIELLDGETVLEVVAPGSAIPSVSITTPTSSSVVTDSLHIAWTASDPDSADQLRYTIQYSPDNGQTWQALMTNAPGDSHGAPMSVTFKHLQGLPGGKQALVRVLASDGYNTTIATSQSFQVTNRPPEPAIISPAPQQSFLQSEALILRGSGFDPEDGQLEGASLTWAIDGKPVGIGKEVVASGLSAGAHVITLTARDSSGAEKQTQIVITLRPTGMNAYLPAVRR